MANAALTTLPTPHDMRLCLRLIRQDKCRPSTQMPNGRTASEMAFLYVIANRMKRRDYKERRRRRRQEASSTQPASVTTVAATNAPPPPTQPSSKKKKTV